MSIRQRVKSRALASKTMRRLVLASAPPKETFHRYLSEIGYNNFQTLKQSGEVYFIERLADRGHLRLAIDVGANVGDYARELARVGFEDAILVEPHPEHAELLSRLAANTGYSFLSFALGEKSGHAELRFRREALSHASLAPEIDAIPYIDNSEAVDVEVRTLDSIWSARGRPEVSLLKIDVEGYEREVLVGADEMLTTRPPKFIQIELNWHQLMRGHSLYSLSKLMPTTYEPYQILPESNGVRRVDAGDPLSNIYLFSNFVFANPIDVRDAFPGV